MYGHALGALPLDVYTAIFRAIEYEPLRDTCRVLNSTLRRCAERVLHERRGEVRLAARAPVATCQVDLDENMSFWRDRLTCACRCQNPICACGLCRVKREPLQRCATAAFWRWSSSARVTVSHMFMFRISTRACGLRWPPTIRTVSGSASCRCTACNCSRAARCTTQTHTQTRSTQCSHA